MYLESTNNKTHPNQPTMPRVKFLAYEDTHRVLNTSNFTTVKRRFVKYKWFLSCHYDNDGTMTCYPGTDIDLMCIQYGEKITTTKPISIFYKLKVTEKEMELAEEEKENLNTDGYLEFTYDFNPFTVKILPEVYKKIIGTTLFIRIGDNTVPFEKLTKSELIFNLMQ